MECANVMRHGQDPSAIRFAVKPTAPSMARFVVIANQASVSVSLALRDATARWLAAQMIAAATVNAYGRNVTAMKVGAMPTVVPGSV